MRIPLRFFIAVLLFVLAANAAVARTWHVTADGMGDAPSVKAAVDSTVAGDVILVGPGTYLLPGILLKSQTSLVSEAGPTQTLLQPAQFPQPGVVGLGDGCRLNGFKIVGGYLSAVGLHGDGIEISYNIIETAVGGVGIAVNYGSGIIHHNLCFGSSGYAGIAIYAFSNDTQINNNIILNGVHSGNTNCPVRISAFCNLINGERNCIETAGTFSGDPLFCGTGNYYLRADSPCAPGNHPDGIPFCGLIGPLPVGCGTVRVEHKTWGQVKALYRN